MPSLWDDPKYVLGTILPRKNGFDIGAEPTPFKNIYVEGDIIASNSLEGVPNADPLGPLGKAIPARKYIIQFGSTVTTTYTSTHIGEMESIPFDGLIMEWTYTHPVFGFIDGVNTICNAYPIPWSLLSTALTNLQATNFVKFTQNFLRLNIGSAFNTGIPVIDAFNFADTSAYLNNIGMITRMAKEGWVSGIAIDTERYNSSPFWDYQNLDQSRTFEEYKARYKILGREVMDRIQKEFPGCNILLFVSYDQLLNGSSNLAQNVYGLMPSFLDGMHDIATGTTTMSNATENAFGHKTVADFNYDVLIQTIPHVPNLGSANYNRVHLTSMATWLDYPGSGFNYSNVSLNYNTPAQFTSNLVNVLERSAKYAVVYTQQPRWWNYTAGVDQMPEQYIAALGNARTEAGLLGAFSIESLPGIQAYWNPFTITAANNDPISSFIDSINSLALTGSGATRPLYKTNGLGTGIPSLNFTAASSQVLNCNALAASMVGTDKPYTVAIVQKNVSNTPTGAAGFGGFGKAGNTNADLSWGISSSSRWIARKADDGTTSKQGNSTTFTTSAPMATSVTVYSARFNGSVVEISVNGTVVLSNFDQVVGTNVFDVFVMGKIAKTGVTQFMDGDIGPFVFCNQYLETSDYLALIRYLGTLCGVTTI